MVDFYDIDYHGFNKIVKILMCRFPYFISMLYVVTMDP